MQKSVFLFYLHVLAPLALYPLQGTSLRILLEQRQLTLLLSYFLWSFKKKDCLSRFAHPLFFTFRSRHDKYLCNKICLCCSVTFLTAAKKMLLRSCSLKYHQEQTVYRTARSAGKKLFRSPRLKEAPLCCQQRRARFNDQCTKIGPYCAATLYRYIFDRGFSRLDKKSQSGPFNKKLSTSLHF